MNGSDQPTITVHNAFSASSTSLEACLRSLFGPSIIPMHQWAAGQHGTRASMRKSTKASWLLAYFATFKPNHTRNRVSLAFISVSSVSVTQIYIMFRSSAMTLVVFIHTSLCMWLLYVCALWQEEAAFCLPCLDFVPPAFLFVVPTGLASTFRGKLAGGFGQIMSKDHFTGRREGGKEPDKLLNEPAK